MASQYFFLEFILALTETAESFCEVADTFYETHSLSGQSFCFLFCAPAYLFGYIKTSAYRHPAWNVYFFLNKAKRDFVFSNIKRLST